MAIARNVRAASKKNPPGPVVGSFTLHGQAITTIATAMTKCSAWLTADVHGRGFVTTATPYSRAVSANSPTTTHRSTISWITGHRTMRNRRWYKRLSCVAPEASQPQRVCHHTDWGEPHFRARHDRIQHAQRGKGDRGGVVTEGPAEILMDRPQGLSRQLDRTHDTVEPAGHQRDIGGLDGDIGAGANRNAEIGLHQGGRVVDAVTNHRDHAALALQPLNLGHFVLR